MTMTRARWTLAIGIAGLAILFGLTATDAWGQAALWENAHWSLAALAAAALGYLSIRDPRRSERWARASMAIGLGIYLVGQLAWDIQSGMGVVTVPAISDLFYLGGAVPIVLGFVRLLRGRLSPIERLAFGIDAATVTATILLLVWVAFGETALIAEDALAGAVLILYPVVYLSGAAIAALAALRIRIAGSWTGIHAITLGLAALGLAWVLWLNEAVTALPPVGSAVNYAFSVTILAVGIGVHGMTFQPSASPSVIRVAAAVETLFPMVASALAIGAIVLVEQLSTEVMDASTQAGAALIIILALARQSLLMVERQRLAERDRALSVAESQARAEAEAALGAHQASETRYREVVEVFGRLGEQLSFAADEPTLIRGGVAALRRLVMTDAGDLLLANASQDRLTVGTAWGTKARQPGDPVDNLQPVGCLGIRRGSVYAMADAEDDLMLPCPAHPVQRGSLMCVPMLALGQTIGVVHLEASRPRAFSIDDERQAQRVAEQVALAIANARLVRTMESMALTDPMTRLHNARFFDPFLDRELAVSRREGAPLGVIMIDLDHFKSFNDVHGHPAGDEALRAFARAALTVLRDSDTLARYGGEEFVVAVRGAGVAETREVAERLRLAVEGASIEVGLGRYASITASFGVASTALHGHQRLHLLKFADRALYRAKRQGRNRVVVAGEPTVNERTAADAPAGLERRRKPRIAAG